MSPPPPTLYSGSPLKKHPWIKLIRTLEQVLAHHITIHPLPPEWGCGTHIRRYRCSHMAPSYLDSRKLAVQQSVPGDQCTSSGVGEWRSTLGHCVVLKSHSNRNMLYQQWTLCTYNVNTYLACSHTLLPLTIYSKLASLNKTLNECIYSKLASLNKTLNECIYWAWITFYF